MSLKNKLNKWVENKLISEEEQQKIMAFEKANNNGFFAKTALVFAGFLIGLGVCLMVAANWDKLPTFVKFILDFALFGGFGFGAYYAIEKQKPHFKDMFLFLCFLMTAASIGLVSQTFQLSGSWTSFALFWSIVSVPYVLLSGSLSFGAAWCFVFLSGLIGDIWEKFFEYLFTHKEGLVWLVLMFGALSYAFELLYQMIKKRVLLPRVFSNMMLVGMYYGVLCLCFEYGLPNRYNTHFSYWIVLFIAVFFICRLAWAFFRQDITSFKRNILMSEGYVFLFFASLFDDLLLSGFGFVVSGLFILLMFYIFKKTSKRIQKWEIFK